MFCFAFLGALTMAIPPASAGVTIRGLRFDTSVGLLLLVPYDEYPKTVFSGYDS